MKRYEWERRRKKQRERDRNRLMTKKTNIQNREKMMKLAEENKRGRGAGGDHYECGRKWEIEREKKDRIERERDR